MANLQAFQASSHQALYRTLQGFGLSITGLPGDFHVYDDEVYVALSTDFIKVYDTSGNVQRSFAGRGTENGKCLQTNGIWVYEDEVYVADGQGRRIQVFSTSGTYTRKWASKYSQIPYHITIYNDNVYVGNAGLRLLGSGKRMGVWDTLGNYSLSISPNSLTSISNDGTNYYFTYFSDVQVRNATGGLVTSWTSGQFNSGISYYSGKVYVTLPLADSVRVTDTSGVLDFSFGSSGTGDGEFNRPKSIRVYNDEIYVIDSLNSRMQVFDIDGNYVRQWSIT